MILIFFSSKEGGKWAEPPNGKQISKTPSLGLWMFGVYSFVYACETVHLTNIVF